MNFLRFLLSSQMFILAACSSAIQTVQPTPTAPLSTDSPAPTPTVAQPTTPVSTTVVAVTPAVTSETLATLTSTKSEWELIQEQVASFRNLLDQNSDGYNGLTEALQQLGLNETWCNGINAAIVDFNYLNSTQNAQALSNLKTAQGCP